MHVQTSDTLCGQVFFGLLFYLWEKQSIEFLIVASAFTPISTILTIVILPKDSSLNKKSLSLV
jgi:hypothetical protein